MCNYSGVGGRVDVGVGVGEWAGAAVGVGASWCVGAWGGGEWTRQSSHKYTQSVNNYA